MGIFWTTLCFLVHALNTDLGVLAMVNSQPQKDSEGLDSLSEDTVSPEMLQEMLWLFRREDPSAWNYCILGLSFFVLLVGIVLLGANIRANRNQKFLLLRREDYEASPPNEAERKQAFLLSNKDNLDSAGDDLLPNISNAGEVMVYWKDGNMTALHADANEVEA